MSTRSRAQRLLKNLTIKLIEVQEMNHSLKVPIKSRRDRVWAHVSDALIATDGFFWQLTVPSPIIRAQLKFVECHFYLMIYTYSSNVSMCTD